MLTYSAVSLPAIARTLTLLEGLDEKLIPSIGKKNKFICDGIRHVRENCVALDLRASWMYTDWMLAQLRDETVAMKDFRQWCFELWRRICDELEIVKFFYVPPYRMAYYENAELFGMEGKLSRVVEDISEAGKCFALARYTACVFHLMRVMEIGTQTLGKRLGVPLVGEKVWQVILDQTNVKIKALPAKTPGEKKRQAKFAESAAHLFNVKLAWRNPVMHPKRTYTEEEAKRIMENVKTFMRHLCGVS